MAADAAPSLTRRSRIAAAKGAKWPPQGLNSAGRSRETRGLTGGGRGRAGGVRPGGKGGRSPGLSRGFPAAGRRGRYGRGGRWRQPGAGRGSCRQRFCRLGRCGAGPRCLVLQPLPASTGGCGLPVRAQLPRLPLGARLRGAAPGTVRPLVTAVPLLPFSAARSPSGWRLRHCQSLLPSRSRFAVPPPALFAALGC